MILVIGNTPQRVELRDLGDCVYYRQQKVFTDSQYAQSQDLQREIRKGSLSIIKKVEDKAATFGLPSSSDSPIPFDDSKIDALAERIRSLEKALSEQKPISIPKSSDNEALKILADKIEKLEVDLSQTRGSSVSDNVIQALQKLEQRIDQNSLNDKILEKIDKLISTGSAGRVQSATPEEVRAEEIYVPSVTVEDANKKIKLDVRKIEQSDNVKDSLAALKKLKSKFT